MSAFDPKRTFQRVCRTDFRGGVSGGEPKVRPRAATANQAVGAAVIQLLHERPPSVRSPMQSNGCQICFPRRLSQRVRRGGMVARPSHWHGSIQPWTLTHWDRAWRERQHHLKAEGETALGNKKAP